MKKRSILVEWVDFERPYKMRVQTHRVGQDLVDYVRYRIYERGASSGARDIKIVEPNTRADLGYGDWKEIPRGVTHAYEIKFEDDGAWSVYQDGKLLDGFRDRGAAESMIELERLKDASTHR